MSLAYRLNVVGKKRDRERAHECQARAASLINQQTEFGSINH